MTQRVTSTIPEWPLLCHVEGVLLWPHAILLHGDIPDTGRSPKAGCASALGNIMPPCFGCITIALCPKPVIWERGAS